MLLKNLILFLIIWQVDAFKNKTCHDLLRELGDVQSKFVDCVTTNSAPVTMCTNCKPHYGTMQITYDILVQNCTKVFFDKDRINMVASTEEVLTDLWSKAYCPDCYNNNNSIVFFDKNQSLSDCLGINTKNPCDMCMDEYMDLNTFYIHLDQHNNGEVCYDLQDSMNRTRNLWSKELQCCKREFNMTLFTVVLSIISCLPLLFYGSTYLITKRQERNHGILNDEDPLFNSSASTSVASTLNVNPSSSNSNSTSTAAPATNKAATVSLPHAKKGFAILNEEPEEEGGVATAEKPADTKKVFNVYSQDSDYESSDDENIAPKVLNDTKQKFK